MDSSRSGGISCLPIHMPFDGLEEIALHMTILGNEGAIISLPCDFTNNDQGPV
jgi:hypothetical protein